MPLPSPKAVLLCSLSLAFLGCAAEEASSDEPSPKPAAEDTGSSSGSPGPSRGPGEVPGAGAKYFASFNFQSAASTTSRDVTQNVAAIFGDRDPTFGAGCDAPEIVGACAVRTCTPPAGSSTPITPGKAPAIGEVTVATPAERATLTNNGQGFWTTATKLSWKPGDMLTAKATGAAGGAPAFELTTTAPPAVTIASPTFPKSIIPTPIEHVRSRDLVATWSEGGAGSVRISLSAASGTKLLHVECEAPVADKKVTIGSALLGRISSPRAQLGITTRSHALKREGDWAISVFAQGLALTPDGRTASGLVKLD
jgi:hypothetical protein